jgi:hypothetical protein
MESFLIQDTRQTGRNSNMSQPITNKAKGVLGVIALKSYTYYNLNNSISLKNITSKLFYEMECLYTKESGYNSSAC